MLQPHHRRHLVGLIPSLAFLAVLAAVAGARWVLGNLQPLQALTLQPADGKFTPVVLSQDFQYRTFCTASLACFVLCLAMVVIGATVIMWRYSATRRVFCVTFIASLIGSGLTFAVVSLGDILLMPCDSMNIISLNAFTAKEVVTSLAEGGIASFAFLLGACGLLLIPTNPSDAQAVQKLARRMRHLRCLLYMGTLVLLANTATIIASFEWARPQSAGV